MKKVKKFETFEELKSYESDKIKDIPNLEKHSEFERIIMEIRAVIVQQNNLIHSNQ